MAPTKKSTRNKTPSRKKKVTKKKILAKKTTKKKASKKAGSKAKIVRTKAVEAKDPRIDRLKTLITLIEKSKLNELCYEDSDIRVSLRQGGALVASAENAAVATAPATESSPSSTSDENDSDHHVICSPFVGTFYTAPSPDSEAYTGMGQTVNQGQTVCIVEAMKLMNEIEAEVSGTVVEVFAENGQGVQYGEPLFKIKVS
jgi:acetyl-CoA carboxylase biotin carboxyl carrier protein